MCMWVFMCWRTRKTELSLAPNLPAADQALSETALIPSEPKTTAFLYEINHPF